jgi:RHS repeat-associated protein
VNGQPVAQSAALDRKTLYTNPYLIVTEAEYTKHYYIEGQRVASKLGGGWAQAGYDPLQDHLSFDDQELNNKLVERFEILEGCSRQNASFVYLQDRFESILNQISANDPENVQYFYHSDHLGSSSFITDASGTVDQHLQYLPFGEPWIDQRTTIGIRFTFSGKEKDEETGYSYFGARYYNADISIWLSVDPLSDERSWLTPYNYCSNNPIIRTDPSGMLDGDYYDQNGNWLGKDKFKDNRVYMADAVTKDNEGFVTGATNATELSVSHTDFQTISNIVMHEAGTSDINENLWLAHTASNAANKSRSSIYSKLMSGYSSVESSNKVPLSTSANGAKANAARAGVIDALMGCADPTGGSTFWDGTDFLAWGLNSPYGNSHAKFRQYSNISISENIYNSYLSGTLGKYPNGKARYDGTYYNIPAAVFSNTTHWSGGSFNYNTGNKNYPGLKATGAFGHSIFWKTY